MKLLNKLALAAVALTASVSSFAAGPDMASLTTAVDFATVTTAILAVAASLVVPYLAFKGAKMVLSAVKGG